ncbi:MAG: chemotaxis protein CheW [Planctomycetota bacterium]
MIADSDANPANLADQGGLFLQIGPAGGRFCLPVKNILEVVPCADLRQIPHGPNSLAGLLDFHGTLIPVVDLGLLISGKVSERRQSTRIVLASLDDTTRLGVLAEGIQTTTRLKNQVSRCGNTSPSTHAFGKDENGVLQILELSTIIPQEILDISASLYREQEG